LNAPIRSDILLGGRTDRAFGAEIFSAVPFGLIHQGRDGLPGFAPRLWHRLAPFRRNIMVGYRACPPATVRPCFETAAPAQGGEDRHRPEQSMKMRPITAGAGPDFVSTIKARMMLSSLSMTTPGRRAHE